MSFEWSIIIGVLIGRKKRNTMTNTSSMEHSLVTLNKLITRKKQYQAYTCADTTRLKQHYNI